ncbi:TetR/AcrR family transcriptional regulator [Rhodococcus sp. IEGM 1379]|uniref:TetR/AcrR family transcriptional regulator n=1 Tax=Rhodococcus sp. IEGM 1379 TaxID=3047086 RepID=UPI0024B7E525|nr:TetR/AcrR family transcriptional regulator [Rhodococcus sp. IEGM 1379]MDI9914181.1 TetR/AcrR family transcriptional regulator [Rhodococcus sp. IEGM 1379]
MSEKRHYSSQVRIDAARRTRELIRDAGAALFVEKGYVGATAKDIASVAGVAPRTVFTAYPGGKLEIFEAALAHALDADLDTSDSGVRAIASDPDDVRRLVSQIVEQGIGLLERAGTLMMVAVESSGADAEMRRLALETSEQSSVNAMSIAEGLAEHGLIRRDISVEKAAGVLAALVSPQLHQQLRSTSGWGIDDYRSWLEFNIRANLMY